MKIAFLSEMSFEGKIPSNHLNMRTEFAWMYALDADHYCIRDLSRVKSYDHVFVIFPKGKTFLSSEGSRISQEINPVSDLLSSNFIELLRLNGNKKVHYIQEGPHWWWNDYEIVDQINFYNLLAQCDSIFAHNEYDSNYYRGLFSGKEIHTMRTLMIEQSVHSMISNTEDKVIIGGNFARWYGGFESYIVASQFELPVYAQTSHAKRDGEEQMYGLTHLPRMHWTDWMNTLKDFKYAVHLMPTVAAGTFSLNCAYFGIPCIGNEKVDTQRLCHPDLSVDVADIHAAKNLAKKLKEDTEFYTECSNKAKVYYRTLYSLDVWKQKMYNILA